MKLSLMKRLEHVEQRQVTVLRLEDRRSEREAAIYNAMVVGNALRLGGNAKEELDADDGSMDLKGRAKLEEQVAAARRIAATLAKYSPAKQVETGEPAWR